ncbi:Endonuclease V [Desulfurobacterium pacificum]|uniref:Endonuclease V n=1 Tax=Desulfurobacterium pacificum TaxID=240166 RepID=A0ABY1NEU5_9BACT|nr:endonuclease V [Desulfurobacterium pacificum]SMP07158.1 Endonuclease V [Desulfurobacterium pacificum]
MKFDFSKAAKAQNILRSKLRLVPFKKGVNFIAGCDLTFLNPYKTPTTGIGAFVVLSFPDLEVVERVYAVMNVNIPYVPGFLAFREIPLLLRTFRKLKNKPDVVIVDGHGIAHPRRLGIAAHFGVVTGIPAIGCAKKPLYGEFEEPCNEKGCYSPIKAPDTGKVLGYVLRSRENVKPVYISPGNLVDSKSALDLMLKIVDRSKYRIPEPTRLAHNYLQEVRKSLV